MEIIQSKKEKIIISLLLLISIISISVNSFAIEINFAKGIEKIGSFITDNIKIFNIKDNDGETGISKISNAFNKIFSKENINLIMNVAGETLNVINDSLDKKDEANIVDIVPETDIVDNKEEYLEDEDELVTYEIIDEEMILDLINKKEETGPAEVPTEVPTTVPEETPKAETKNTYTIVFNANGGTGNMRKIDVTYGETKELPENEYSKTNYTFVGWYAKKIEKGTTKCFGYNKEGKRAWYVKEELDDKIGYCGYYIYKDKAEVSSQAKSGTVTMTAIWSKNEQKTYEEAHILNKEDNSRYGVIKQNVGLKIVSEGETRDRAIFEGYIKEGNNITYDSSNNTIKINEKTEVKKSMGDSTTIAEIYQGINVVYLASKEKSGSIWYKVRIQGLIEKEVLEKNNAEGVINSNKEISSNGKELNAMVGGYGPYNADVGTNNLEVGAFSKPLLKADFSIIYSDIMCVKKIEDTKVFVYKDQTGDEYVMVGVTRYHMNKWGLKFGNVLRLCYKNGNEYNAVIVDTNSLYKKDGSYNIPADSKNNDIYIDLYCAEKVGYNRKAFIDGMTVKIYPGTDIISDEEYRKY